MKLFKKTCLFLLLGLILAGSLFPQEGSKVLTLEDYPRWKHIVSPEISPDGSWAAYGLRPNGGDIILYIKQVGTEKAYEITYGSGAAFSEDSSWIAYRLGVSKKETEKLRKEKKPIPVKVELLSLQTGKKQLVENGAGFLFSKNSGFLAVKKARSDTNAKHKGADLVLVDLKTGGMRNIGNVAEYAFNKPGSLLAYTVDAADKQGNGLYFIRLDSGAVLPLDTGEADYSQIAWSEEGRTLAVLKGTQAKDKWEKDNLLLAFLGLKDKEIASVVYDPSQDPDFPENMVISERVPPRRGRGVTAAPDRALIWSKDCSRIYCGIKAQEQKAKKSEDPLPNVDVWHWKDKYIQSVQTKRAEQDLNFTFRAVFHLKDRRFIRLADENMRMVTLSRDGKWGVGRDNSTYLSDVETMQADYYLVDPVTGKKSVIAKGIRRTLGISPQGGHFLFLKDGKLLLNHFTSGKTIDISSAAGVGFVNQDDDRPYEKPPYGLAGWSKDRKSVLVYHKYDIWQLSLDGKKAENLTRGIGEKEEIRFRYIKLDPEEKFIDSSQPLMLSAYGEWTKKSGFYSLKVGDIPERLVYGDKLFGSLRKAKKAEKFLFTRQDFFEFPDLHISDRDFSDSVRVSDANPQQAEYAWGKRVLIDYVNGRGKKLQATLALPAGYQPEKRYPMLVYFYEKMSQRHHQYSMPTYDDRPHISAYASDGYLVLMPDIVFEIGQPGTSSLDCIRSAVQKTIDLGYADPEHIGLQGHSWGGFQAAFIVTQTDLFACVVAGAAPSCIEGEFNQVFKSSGNNNHSYYSRSQGRMGTDPWKDHALYRTQSAIQNADKISTPFLLLHGTEDGSVDWIQSLEYYNAARYLGKEVIFLSYPGEPHHLAKEENQKDFQKRMKQYFDHYLKGKPKPEWMEKGVPYLKKKRLMDAQKESSEKK